MLIRTNISGSRLFITGILILFSLSLVSAQLSQGGKPLQSSIMESSLEWIDLDDVNVNELLLEDELISTNGKTTQRIAKEVEVSISPEQAGTWEDSQDGTLIWSIGIRGKGARALGVMFDRYVLTKGIKIYIYDPSETNKLGAYTSLNNKASGGLAISYLQGDELIIQMEIPPESTKYGELRIGSVRWAYLPVFEKKSLEDTYFGRSGNCNIDINCSLGNDWQLVKNSVVRMINTELCTGVLINNVRQDEKAYIFTAAHCVFDRFTGEYQPTVFYFNYESPTCNGPDGFDANSISGASLIATGDTMENPRDADSLDFALLELSLPPPNYFLIHYAGWNRSPIPALQTTSIHHPRGDVKKISLDLDPPQSNYHTEDYLPEFVKYSHWRILEWDTATTEPGSTGCPLFNQNQHVVGTLTGGAAVCENPINDYYTKFNYAWDYYSEPTKQLKHWLDPDNTEVMSIPGFEPSTTGCLLRNIQLNKNDITCHGYSDGTIELSLLGTGPMDYYWSNGDTSQIISGLSAGWYKVAVTDTIGCTLSDSIEIIEPNPFSLNFINNVSPTYYGFDDGSATIEVEGGTPPYQYMWDDPGLSTTSSGKNLRANTVYHVIVTDINQCMAEDSIILADSKVLFTRISIIEDITCHGYSDGSVMISVLNFEPPLSYMWDHDTTLNDSIAHSLQAGITYHVSVTDAAGNTGVDSIVLTEPLPPNFGIAFTVDKQLLTAPPFAFQFNNNTPNMLDYIFMWNFGDDTTIINNNAIVFHEYNYNGTYDVKLLAKNRETGCIDSVLFKEYIYCTGGEDPASIKKIDGTMQIHIYPNPSRNRIIIEFPNPMKENYSLYIMDLSGKIVHYQDNICTNLIEFLPAGLSTGIYTFKLIGSKIHRGKFVFE
jgi:PKD repeat protein